MVLWSKGTPSASTAPQKSTQSLMDIHEEILEERQQVDEQILDIVDEIQPINEQLDVLNDQIDELEIQWSTKDAKLGRIQEILYMDCWLWDSVEKEFFYEGHCDGPDDMLY